MKGYVTPKIMNHWKAVAHSLGYNTSMIAEIEKRGTDPMHRCNILFEDWLKTDHGVTPKTWETLLKIEELSDNVEEIRKQIK